MQRAITVARRHDEKAFIVLTDPSVHPGEQVQEFRKIASTRTHPEFAEVEIWTSGAGVTKRAKFRPVIAESEAPAGDDEQPQEQPPEDKPEDKTPEQKPAVDSTPKTSGGKKSAK